MDSAKLGIDLVSFLALVSWKFRAKSPLANVNHVALGHTLGLLVWDDPSPRVSTLCLLVVMMGKSPTGSVIALHRHPSLGARK